MSKHAANDHEQPRRRRSDPMDVWRAHDRYYYGQPLLWLVGFLLVMGILAWIGRYLP
jgi:hypothetical protein